MSSVEQPASKSEPLSDIGRRIRAYRTMRRVTLKQLAEHVGVSEGFLSQVERGTSGPSITTLHLIAEAFGMTIADLFSEGHEPSPQVLCAEARPQITLPGVVKHLMTQRPLQNIEVLQGDFDPGATCGGPNNVHGDSQELLFILAGDFRLELGEQSHELHTQDSIEYRSSVPHRLVNIGSEPAQALWIISPPSL